MKRSLIAGLVGGIALAWSLEARALPWPERASWDDCIEFGVMAEQIASIRDRASSQGFTIETARSSYVLASRRFGMGARMHEALVLEIYPSTLPQEGMAHRYAMTCIKRYRLRPPSNRPARIIILEYDR